MLNDLKRLLRAGKTVVLTDDQNGSPRAFVVENNNDDIYNAMSDADSLCDVVTDGTIEGAVKWLAAKIPDN